jgi:diacylglycerol kinase (ATP)
VTDLLAVMNSDAGSAQPKAVDAALAALETGAERTGGRLELARTASPAQLDAVLKQLHRRRLVLLGGDGSIHAAIQCLYRQDALRQAGPIGIIPLGTGNDLAGLLDIPDDPVAAAHAALGGTARPMELLVSSGGLVAVNAVHVGIGVTAASRASALKRRLRRFRLARLAYPLGAIAAGATESGLKLDVRVDGELLHGRAAPALMVALGVGQTVGGGAQLIPGADPHDGGVDVVVWESVTLPARVAYAVGLKDGRHAAREDARTARGRRVEIRAAAGKSFLANIDGEVHGPFTEHDWQARADAWSCLVPEGG